VRTFYFRCEYQYCSVLPVGTLDGVSSGYVGIFSMSLGRYFLLERYMVFPAVESCNVSVCAALLDMKQHRKIHLDTEVWSWGIGDHGQLGHADLLNRLLLFIFLIFDHMISRCLLSSSQRM